MKHPFTTTSLNLWLDLIEQGIRLRNPKIVDLGPLRSAAVKANKATFPRLYQDMGANPFSDMRRNALYLERADGLRRQDLIELTTQNLATLISTELRYGDKAHMVDLALRDFAAFREFANRAVSKDSTRGAHVEA